MSTTYLMSRPGRPLHLMTFAYDQPSQSELYPTGHQAPLCGSGPGTRHWQFTGPWAQRWQRHSQAGLCGRCNKKLTQLRIDAEAVYVGESSAIAMVTGRRP